MKSSIKRKLSFLLVFAMICSVLLPFSNKSNAKEVEGDIIKKASVTDADGNPFKPGQKIGAWQAFRIYAEFELPDNVVKENDTTTMELPIGFNTSPPDHFDIKDGEEVIAHAKMYNQNPAKIVLIYTKYAETHSGIKGKFYFNVSVNAETQTGSGELPVTLTVNGKIILAGKVDYNPPHFTSQQLIKGGWMTSDKTKGRYDIRLNQNNVVLTNAKFIDTIQSDSVEFDENSIQILQGQWENKITVMKFLNRKDVTQEFKDAGKIKFEGKKLTIDIGSIGAENINRGFQILYEVKLKYDPVAGEEIKNKAEFTNGADSHEQNSTYKIRDAGGTGEGYLFKIKVQKTGKDNTPLAGAKFDVIRVRNKSKVGEIITKADGSGEIGKLIRDEYQLVETEAPQGYQKLTAPITVNPADFGTTKVALKNIKNEPEEKIKVSGEKTWDDANNQDGKRPDSIKVILNKTVDGVISKVTDKVVTKGANDKWEYEFKNLPKYENGKLITYSIDEEAVAGYVTGILGYNITNTHTPEKVSISGEKTWEDNNNQDGKRPESITVKLIKQVEGGQPEVKETKVVTKGADDKWKYEFNNLPKYKNGKLITYFIDEEEVTGYEKEITGYNLKNKFTPRKTSVKVTKAWEDKDNQDGKRPTSVTIKLLENETPTNKTLTLTKENGWKGSFDNLDEYKNGQKIDYSIEEEDIGNGYAGFIGQTSETEFNVVNKREPEKTFVEGSKTWDDKNDQDGKRPTEIKINLLKNGIKVATKTVTKADDWKWKFENLDKYENGEEINYTITEEKVEEYTTVVKGSDVINTHAPGKTSVQVTKAWEDKNNQDGVRPDSVTVRLIADGTPTDKTLTLTKDNNWTGSFTDLDEYKAGKKIEYTVREETVGNGYTSVVTKIGENNFTVTNTREPEKTFVEGSKTWDDKDNQDGKRPTEITVNLLKNGKKVATKKVTEKDGWKWRFENLDKYENGELINYTIVEEKVEGYTTEVEGHNVKNSYTPGKTSVQVTKAWKDNNDQDKKRPDSVTIELLADGKETGKKVVLTKDNNWTGSFTDLNEYKDGKKIEYTVKEKAVGNGYKSEITGNAKEGFVVTNVRTPKPRIPKTGAGSNSALYTVLLGLSGTALFSVFRRKRKEDLK